MPAVGDSLSDDAGAGVINDIVNGAGCNYLVVRCL